MLYTCEQVDADSGMYYLRARYYDPSIGRFLSQDPLPGGNLYAYVGNNPVNRIDPTGLGWTTDDWRWVKDKEGGNFGGGSGPPDYITYAGMVCVIAVPADGPAPVGDASCVVIGGAIIVEGLCIAYCDDIINEIGKLFGNLFSDGGVPDEAGRVLEGIEERGGAPLPGYEGGRTFENREGKLPEGGEYNEYDVHPRTEGAPRGRERIVRDKKTGKAWYTPDHYETLIPMN